MFKRLLPVILVLASPAWAGISYYVGDAAGFSTAAGPTGLNLSLSGVLDFSGVNSAGVSFAVSSGFLDISGGVVSYISVDASNYLQINTPTSVYAIGMYLSKSLPVSSNWNYAPGQSIGVPTSPGIFFGVISDTPLTSLPPILLTAQAGGAPISLQNFVLGTQGSTPPIDEIGEAPEASSMVLMGGSLVALAVMARRKKLGSLLVTEVQ